MGFGTGLAIQNYINAVQEQERRRATDQILLNRLMREQPLIQTYATQHNLNALPTDVFQRRLSPQQPAFSGWWSWRSSSKAPVSLNGMGNTTAMGIARQYDGRRH